MIPATWPAWPKTFGGRSLRCWNSLWSWKPKTDSSLTSLAGFHFEICVPLGRKRKRKSPTPKCLVFLTPSIPHSWFRVMAGCVVLTTDLVLYRFHWDSEKLGYGGLITQTTLNLNPFGNSLPGQGDETRKALCHSNQVLLQMVNVLNNNSFK